MLENTSNLAILGTPARSRGSSHGCLLERRLEAIEGSGRGKWVRPPRFHHQYLPPIISRCEEPAAFIEPFAGGSLEHWGATASSRWPGYGICTLYTANKQTGDITACSDHAVWVSAGARQRAEKTTSQACRYIRLSEGSIHRTVRCSILRVLIMQLSMRPYSAALTRSR